MSDQPDRSSAAIMHRCVGVAMALGGVAGMVGLLGGIPALIGASFVLVLGGAVVDERVGNGWGAQNDA